ncbi:MAG: ABC transporter permease [Dehalococcoidia bacterium]
MALLIFAGSVFVLYLALPLLTLLIRAAEDGRVWELLLSRPVLQALWLSLTTSTIALAVVVLFGTPLAYALARIPFTGRSLVEALVDLPMVLPPTVAGVGLLTTFGSRGLLGEPLYDLTGVRLTFTTVAVIMAQILVAAPFYVRAARSGFASVDPQLERVAYTLGVSRVETFWRVTLPLARPGLIAGVVLCWTRALGELGATLIFAGSLEGRTRTMPLAMIDALDRGTLGLSGAVAMAVILLAVAGTVLFALRMSGAGEAAGR